MQKRNGLLRLEDTSGIELLNLEGGNENWRSELGGRKRGIKSEFEDRKRKMYIWALRKEKRSGAQNLWEGKKEKRPEWKEKGSGAQNWEEGRKERRPEFREKKNEWKHYFEGKKFGMES
jgi:hypothetical protein